MNCLIIKNDGIGDLILCSGIIASLSEIFKGKVDLITCEENREIANLLHGVEQTYYVSRDDIKIGYPLTEKDQNVLTILKEKEYDYVICLRRFIRQSTLVLMKQVRSDNKYCAWQFPTNTTYEISAEFSKSWNHFYDDTTIIHELEYYKSFIHSIFSTEINIKPRLKLNVNTRTRDDSAFPRLGIVIGGNSSKWTTGHWIQLIQNLQKDKWRIRLFGGEKEKLLSQQIRLNCPGIEDFVGQLSFKESVLKLDDLDFLIGNDTGFTHFASLIVPRLMVVLGGGTFKRFFPWPGTTNQYVIYYGMGCFDCDWHCRLSEKFCISFITPDHILKYVRDIISEKKNIEKTRNINPIVDRYKLSWRHNRLEAQFAFFKDER